MTEVGELSAMRDRLRAQLEDLTPALVEAYFRRDEPAFAGELFNTFGVNDPFAVGADDLLAVGFLDEAFDAEAAFVILVRDRGTYDGLLHEIPSGRDLWDDDAVDDVSDRSPASRLWQDLRGIHGVGPVRAGKLLARKRPRLIPVWDSVIEEALKPPQGQYWLTLRECLRERAFLDQVKQLRPPGLSPLVSDLRLLDVAVWMRCSESKAVKKVRDRYRTYGGEGAK